MFFLLIKVRLRAIANIAADQIRRSPWRSAALSALGAGLFVGLYFVFLFLFSLASAMALLTETIYQVFYFLFLFLLAGSTPFVAATLLHSSDYSLLFSSPIPARSVVAAKLIDATVTNSLQFTILGAPALAACAAALNVGLYGWILLPILAALFVLVPALITAFGLLVLLAMLGARRLRSAVTALNAVMAAIACITIVLESPHLPIRPGDDALLPVVHDVVKASPAAHALPCAWFADALMAYSSGGSGSASAIFAVMRVTALVIALSAGCLILGGRLISAANLDEECRSTGARSDSSSLIDLGGTLGALVRKDWCYVTRDSILLSQLTMPLILFAVPFILTLQDPTRRFHGESFIFASGIVAVIVFMQTSILSLSSLGVEGKAYWIAMTSPAAARTILISKLLLSTLFAGCCGAVLTLIAAAIFRADWQITLAELGIILVSSAALSGLGVGLAASFPRFVYENPAHRVSAWALILGFFATTGYVALSGILFAAAWILTGNLGGSMGASTVIWTAVLIYLCLSATAVCVPVLIGARRIESYQWEH